MVEKSERRSKGGLGYNAFRDAPKGMTNLALDPIAGEGQLGDEKAA